MARYRARLTPDGRSKRRPTNTVLPDSRGDIQRPEPELCKSCWNFGQELGIKPPPLPVTAVTTPCPVAKYTVPSGAIVGDDVEARFVRNDQSFFPSDDTAANSVPNT
jgi:hypothetical protein